MSPKLAQHSMRVALDAAIFHRIAIFFAERASLRLEEGQLRLLERMHLNLVRSGAALEPTARARMGAISERLAVLHTAFGQNVLHDEKVWALQLTEAELEGLPDFVRTGAAGFAADCL